MKDKMITIEEVQQCLDDLDETSTSQKQFHHITKTLMKILKTSWINSWMKVETHQQMVPQGNMKPPREQLNR
ncbi:hypothetical protein HanRHA438_Chr04g0164891 [Helianthus annuus]|nr:hypothetical protein HanHA300_Chr04g0127241 [Helianthus annuus]KAJ0596207.1 hypothetical protein HanHA89_Chr04g0140171 [Helianthus annuus]KAJ0756862.1 hypothetical protein HanLR1_Chr04g0131951 [Helianthus annuus]KAJ0760598.1 hypothetical protein HanOQP8_Chr04g0139851 [Helianthus annuus]KAJ0925894.1 hypothetical protein HanRHA438_Chr04g0164891 [Helianthus annuus]